MAIQDLPPEIRPQILQHLPRLDLFRCLSLCRSWSPAVLEEFYQKLTLSQHNVHFFQEKLRLQVIDGRQRITQLDQIGSWVKKIIVKQNLDTNRKLGDGAEVLAFFSYFPNLKVLEFTQINDFQLYVETMRECIETETYWSHLQEIILPQHLTTVTVKLQALYMGICYVLRSSITSLIIHHPDFRRSYLADNTFRTYSTFLPDFKQLTRLQVYNFNYYNADINLTMIEILQATACPNLVEFQFCTDIDVQDKVADVYLDSVTMNEENKYNNKKKQPLYNNMQHLSSFRYIYHLRSMSLEIPIIKRAYMKYIVSYIDSRQLDTFKLVMYGLEDDHEFDDWLTQGGSDTSATTVLQLAQHLSSVKNLTIRIDCKRRREPAEENNNKNNNEEQEEVITTTAEDTTNNEASSSFTQQVERFWKFVAAIKGNRQLFCHANIRLATDPSGEQQNERNYSASFIVNNNQQLMLEYSFFIIDHYLLKHSTPLPPSSLLLCSENEKHIVNLLSVYVITGNYVFLNEVQKAQLLHNILDSFDGLEELYIHEPGAPPPRLNCILKSATNNKIQISTRDDTMMMKTARTKSQVMSTTVDTLTQLKISHSSLTTELFTTLSTDLPNLKTIQYTGFYFEYDESYNAQVDLRHVKNLNCLEILLADFQFRQYKRLMIIFVDQEDSGRPLWKYTTAQDVLVGETDQTYQLILVDDDDEKEEEYRNDPSSLVLKIIWGRNIKKFTLMDIFEHNTFEVVLPIQESR